MKSFWLKFGRADARSMAEARRAVVRLLVTIPFIVVLLLSPFCMFLCLCVFFFFVSDIGFEEGGGPPCCYGGTGFTISKDA